MGEVTIIGIDLAKRSFQVHGARADGSVAYRRKLSRGKLLGFLASQPPCTVAMEACASSHYWGREIAALGHQVRLVPPIYVKPFVKRSKNDAADAEAITEAAQRPTMHFVAVKTEAQQAQAMLFHTRDLLVRQRTQTINALRGHLAEYGVVAPQGRARIGQLAGVLEDGDCGLPEAVVELGSVLLGRIEELDEKIDGLDRKIRTSARECEETARLMTIPGIGPVTAMAIQAFAPPMESFRRGRDFSAWLGLVPRQHTTGGKPRLGRISKMGQRDLRRLLVMGAMAVIRHASRRDEAADPWLAGMLARKPKEAGRGGARQPNGTEGLGGGHRRGSLPGSRCRLSGRRKEGVEKREKLPGDVGGRTHERSKGKQSARRGRKNQLVATGPRARFHDLDPISRTPYGPAANTRRNKRPDIRQYLTRLHRPSSQIRLAHLGASTYDLDPISRTPYGPAANTRRNKRPDIRQYLTRLHRPSSQIRLAHLGASTYGYYGHYCFLPLYITCGGRPLFAQLRPGNSDPAGGVTAPLGRIIERLREEWPWLKILLRADSAYAREEILAWCEDNGVDYVIGLAKNSRLIEKIGWELADAQAEAAWHGRPARRFAEFTYATRTSWSRRRRVVAKAEHLPGKANPRFVVTSLPAGTFSARTVYERVYCPRGDMENTIKEQQLDLFSDRTSASRFAANQLRLLFSAFASVLFDAMRRALAGTRLARATAGTLRLKLLKIGARVTVSVRRVRVAMDSSHPSADAFAHVHARLRG